MSPDLVSPAGFALTFPPGLILVAAGLALLGIRGFARAIVLLGAPIVTLALVWLVPDGTSLAFDWLGLRIEPLRVDALSRLFATVFAVMTFAGGLFALKQESWSELASGYVYAGSAIGVVFAGDLITVFVFWEVMAIGSTLVIWSASGTARAAGFRYVVMHLLGGVLLMAGIAGHVASTGSVAFTAMQADSPAHWFILAGFLLNAGAPPLSAWLPDAYPEASWSGTVFLSAFTTKTAVYVLLRGFPGEDLLIWIGLYMVFYGIVYAILENDVRRIFAYSIVSQVGFMVTGIGIGTELALNGAATHAFVHIIYKALLLMSAGSVIFMTGKRKCTDLGGLFRTMPITMVCGIIGALSISAFPLTSGFIAKAIVSEAAAGEKLAIVWFLLTAASAGGFLYIGVKFPWFVFFQKDSGLRPADPPWPMRTAMILLAVLCVALGAFPQWLYSILPYPVDYAPYTSSHVIAQLQLLLFSGLAFFVLLGWLKPTDKITLDFDWFWRRAGKALASDFGQKSDRAWGGFVGQINRAALRFLKTVYRHHGPTGLLARAWPTGSMAFWATFLLGAYLVFYYL